MGIYDDITNDVSAAFDTDLADAAISVTITKYERGQYNPATGLVEGEITNQQVTRGVYTGNWQYEVYNSPIEPTDETFLMLQSEIDFEPDIGSTIESVERGTSRIIEIRKDPVNSIYEFRISF